MRNVLISSSSGGTAGDGSGGESGVFTQHVVTGSLVSSLATCHRYTLQSVAPGLLSCEL